MGAWVRSPEWKEGLDYLERWWALATDYVSSEGYSKLENGFGIRGAAVARMFYELTTLDPMPLWELTLKIELHASHNNQRQGFDPRTMLDIEVSELSYLVDRAIPLVSRFRALGIVYKKPADASAGAVEMEIVDGPDAKCVGQFNWKGKSHMVTHTTWKFLRSIWGKHGVPFCEIGDEVWGDDSKSNGTIKGRLSRLNSEMVVLGIPLSWSSTSERVYLQSENSVPN